MDTPRARSPRPLPPLSSSKPTPPLPPPPPSAAASPSATHDFPFAFSSYSASSSPTIGGHLHPLSSMSRAPVGRVGSDLSHVSYSKASTRHPTTSYGATGGSKDDRDRAKSNRTPPFFSGLGGAWRNSKEITSSSSSVATKRKDKAKSRAADVGQWVKKHMAAMVEQLRSSFYGQAPERERHRRPRPHSFSGRGPNAAAREVGGRRGQPLSSAPASLRVSPANSGHLSVGGSVKVSTSSEESTMEELQSAIEAAIAHCKSSMSRAQQQADGDGRRGDRTN